ncbi:MAG: rRNA maturation RNase YbeY [Oligoflexia bacterium]|nr:rRNA maturation RNase YbeY [Oligoflexia bacterium]
MKKTKIFKNGKFSLFFDYRDDALSVSELSLIFKELNCTTKALNSFFDSATISSLANINNSKDSLSLNLRGDAGINVDLVPKKVINTTYSYLKKKFKATEDIELNIFLCGKKKITNLNNTYLKKNKPTDVLSFPLHNFFDGDENDFCPFILFSLGDIFICKEVAKKMAKINKVKFNEEFRLLLIHGILHLLGFDHEHHHKHVTKESANLMFYMEALLFYKVTKRVRGVRKV